MRDVRFLEAEHDVAQLGQAEPVRHLAAQHAAFGFARAPTFAGDDEHEPRAVVLGAPQEMAERRVGLGLREAMQVDPLVDRDAAAREPAASRGARAWRDRGGKGAFDGRRGRSCAGFARPRGLGDFCGFRCFSGTARLRLGRSIFASSPCRAARLRSGFTERAMARHSSRSSSLSSRRLTAWASASARGWVPGRARRRVRAARASAAPRAGDQPRADAAAAAAFSAPASAGSSFAAARAW